MDGWAVVSMRSGDGMLAAIFFMPVSYRTARPRCNGKTPRLGRNGLTDTAGPDIVNADL